MQLTAKTAEALHKKYASTPEALDLVLTHCKIIWDIASQLIERGDLEVDGDMVKFGCLVHDIGLYRLIDADNNIDSQYIKHGVLGYELLKDEGFPETICRFASHHTGVGLSKADVREQHLPLPEEDYLADTKEELLIMYADKFHSKTQPPTFVTFEGYKKYVAKFGIDKVEKFTAMADTFGIPDLEPIIGKYGHRVSSI